MFWTAETAPPSGGETRNCHLHPVATFTLGPVERCVGCLDQTFREQALLNNADQIPKLPDWAIVDLNTPPDGKWPGEVKAAGFFDEKWNVPAK